MYNIILFSPYQDAVKRFPLAQVDSVRRVLTFKDDATVIPYHDKSDIIVYYDMISDSLPLLLVERVLKKSVKMRLLKKAVSKLNKKLDNYNVSYKIDKSKTYVDIIVVSIDIYNKITEV